MSAAIISVLHNVRPHAGPGASVILHADYDPAEAEWELTIRDDGVGFDAASTRPGYGLSQIAGRVLEEHRVTSHVHSEPGVGTTVAFRGKFPT